ncbi:uncharacterized protein LOC120326419 isoform X1 [Styela clava]
MQNYIKPVIIFHIFKNSIFTSYFSIILTNMIGAVIVVVSVLLFVGSAEILNDQKNCHITESLVNGFIRPENRTFIEIGEYFEYFCNEGFRIRGRHKSICMVGKTKARLKGFMPKCKDKNECRRRPCNKYAKCKNISGSYECACKSGFLGDGMTCVRETTMLPSTAIPGCYENGKHYLPGATISSGQVGNWCYSTICGDADGTVIESDDFNCNGEITVPTTTFPTPIMSLGCKYEGKFYSPGATISSEQSGNWCYWSICNGSGNIIQADDFNCNKESSTAVPTTNPTSVRVNTGER